MNLAARFSANKMTLSAGNKYIQFRSIVRVADFFGSTVTTEYTVTCKANHFLGFKKKI